MKEVVRRVDEFGAHLGPWEDANYRSGLSVPLELQPGRRAKLDLGGSGTIGKGKVTLTGEVPADLDCTYSLNYLVSRTPGIAPTALPWKIRERATRAVDTIRHQS